MGKLILIVVAMVGVFIIGGAAFLMVWDIPAPSGHVEKVIPDARFPK
jgi:hypothetical protein